MDNDEMFERSSGNVFADLNLPDADDLHIKADLAHAVNIWTPVEPSEQDGITQEEAYRIGRFQLDGFSQERLQAILKCLVENYESSCALSWKNVPGVEREPLRCGGAVTFIGTRDKLSTVFANIGHGGTEYVVEQYGVPREKIEDLLEFLAQSCEVPPRDEKRPRPNTAA